MSVDAKLDCCPFCSGDAELVIDCDEQYKIVCCECKASFSGTTKQRAITGWNNRRVNGFINWLDAEKEKFEATQQCVAGEVTVKVLTRCKKQLVKLLKGMGL